MNLVNGIESGRLDPRDRGLCYGDGVFRTLAVRAGKPVLWRRQYAKLAADSAALRIDCPSLQTLERDLAQVAARHADGVIRITLTRGIAARGYAIPEIANITRIVSWSPAPGARVAEKSAGARVCWCSLRLAIQPALAGIKHLNRMENVLARSEWHDPDIAEGLLRDANGHVIGGTMSNLFLLRAGELGTPALEGSGVAGVIRDLIIERARKEGLALRIGAVAPDEVRAADALFLVNSVIGVWPVAALGDMTWGANPFADRLRSWIKDAENR